MEIIFQFQSKTI